MSVNRLSVSTQAHRTSGLARSHGLNCRTLAIVVRYCDSETTVSMMSRGISRTESTSALAYEIPAVRVDRETTPGNSYLQQHERQAPARGREASGPMIAHRDEVWAR